VCSAQAFRDLASGQKGAMAQYNEFQVKQLTRLIEVTRTSLSKADRQKVMNMITIDAHSRDMVANIGEAKADKPDCFLWMCQLRSYWDDTISDCRIKICDASFPYGYEYLGNGARLVITPLTDRIYITATQACWLCLGTAPAGPAGACVLAGWAACALSWCEVACSTAGLGVGVLASQPIC
jgi:dynein heavy chain, axonemal